MRRLLFKVRDRNDAEEAIRVAAEGCFAIAAVTSATGLFLLWGDTPKLFSLLGGDVLFLCLAGYSLQKRKSRLVAVAVLVYGAFVTSLTLLNALQVDHGYPTTTGGTNAVLGFLLCLGAVNK